MYWIIARVERRRSNNKEKKGRKGRYFVIKKYWEILYVAVVKLENKRIRWRDRERWRVCVCEREREEREREKEDGISSNIFIIQARHY